MQAHLLFDNNAMITIKSLHENQQVFFTKLSNFYTFHLGLRQNESFYFYILYMFSY